MESRASRKERTGIVISNKIKKSIIVKIDRTAKHPKYGRIMKKSVKVAVHDENNSAKVGDRVKIQETRPLSKNKRWRFVEVLK